LWFHVDGDSGASYWDELKCYKDHLMRGFFHSTNPEEDEELCKIIEEQECRKIEEFAVLLRTKQLDDYELEDDISDPPTFIYHMTKSGEKYRFDISRSALQHFGFFYGQRVNTVKGHGTVVGVKDGFWWIHLDIDGGASYWDNCHSYEDLLGIDVFLIPNAPDISDEQVIALALPLTEVQVKETYFLVNKQWFDAWQAFVLNNSLQHPGKINNRQLLSTIQIQTLQEACISCLIKNQVDIESLKGRISKELVELMEKSFRSVSSQFSNIYYFLRRKRPWQLQLKALIENEDYVRLPERWWRLLVSTYGGGPALTLEY